MARARYARIYPLFSLPLFLREDLPHLPRAPVTARNHYKNAVADPFGLSAMHLPHLPRRSSHA